MPIAEPQPVTDNVTPRITELTTKVSDSLTAAQNRAKAFETQTAQLVSQINTLISNVAQLLPEIDIQLDPMISSVAPYVAPAKPVQPGDSDFVNVQPPTAPSLPTISALTLPALPAAPESSFELGESGYESTLLTELRALLATWIEGTATGIDPDVEAAIWNRARDREVQTRLAAEDDAMNLFAARGFRKPPGALSLELQRAAQAAQSQDIAASREIAVNQAQLEQANRHKAIEASVTSEGQLITYESGVAQRAFDAARLARQLPVEVFRARTDAFRSQIEGSARAKEIEIEARVKAPLEIYRGQVDTFKSRVEAEAARVAAVGKVYETRARVFEAMSKGEADRVDAQLRMHAAELNLNVEEVRLRTQIAMQKGQITMQKYQLIGDILKATASMTAQLIAGSLSSVHLSAGISASAAAGFNMAQSNSTNLSASSNFTETLTNSNTNTTSNTTSTDTNYNYNYNNPA